MDGAELITQYNSRWQVLHISFYVKPKEKEKKGQGCWAVGRQQDKVIHEYDQSMVHVCVKI